MQRTARKAAAPPDKHFDVFSFKMSRFDGIGIDQKKKKVAELFKLFGGKNWLGLLCPDMDA